MTISNEIRGLQQGIDELKSKINISTSLFRVVATLTRTHIHGISKVTLMRNLIFSGLTILGNSLLVASFYLILYQNIIYQKIQQTKTFIKNYLQLHASQTSSKFIHICRRDFIAIHLKLNNLLRNLRKKN